MELAWKKILPFAKTLSRELLDQRCLTGSLIYVCLKRTLLSKLEINFSRVSVSSIVVYIYESKNHTLLKKHALIVLYGGYFYNFQWNHDFSRNKKLSRFNS